MSARPDAARGLRDADRQPRGRHAARSRRARRGRSRPLRGHAADADPPRPPRPLRAPPQLPRAQRGRSHGRGAPAARGGSQGGARQRRRPPWGQRPRGAVDRGRARSGECRSRCCRERRRSRRRSSSAGSRPSATSSSATCRGARSALGAVWDELRRWPWPAVAFESPRRLPPDAGVPRARLAGPPRRRLPRADQAVRGGRARLAFRGRRTLLRAAKRGDHPRSRPLPIGCRTQKATSARSRRSTSSSRPAWGDGRRPTSSPGSPGCAGTRSTGAHCDETVTRFDNGGEASLPSFACCLHCERRVPPQSLSLLWLPRRRHGPGRRPARSCRRFVTEATRTPRVSTAASTSAEMPAPPSPPRDRGSSPSRDRYRRTGSA